MSAAFTKAFTLSKESLVNSVNYKKVFVLLPTLNSEMSLNSLVKLGQNNLYTNVYKQSLTMRKI